MTCYLTKWFVFKDRDSNVSSVFKTILQWIMVLQKVPNSYFQSQFSMSKINRIFSKKESYKNINLGDHFLLNTFFLDSIFEPLYFLKLGSIFVGPTLCQFTKYSNFIRLLLIFEQKPCFLRPIKQETPWRNWHYCI